MSRSAVPKAQWSTFVPRTAVLSPFGRPGGTFRVTSVLRTAVLSPFGRPGGAFRGTSVLRTAMLSPFGRPGGAHDTAAHGVKATL